MTMFGPRVRTQGKSPSWSKYQNWYVQKPTPYRVPLPYTMQFRERYTIPNGLGITNRGDATISPGDLMAWDPAYTEALNKAYAKFKDKVGETAELAVNVLEYKQSVDLIASNAMRIFKFANALMRFRFGDAAKALGLDVLSEGKRYVKVRDPDARRQGKRLRKNPNRAPSKEIRLKRGAKDFGNNFLQYHFGLEPLMKDIGVALDVLIDPIFTGQGRHIMAGATAKAVTPYPSTVDFALSEQYKWDSGVALRGDVVVNSPNLVKAQQLGLVNPASWLWERIPFSFIADWFGTLGLVLGSWTDFLGMSLLRTSTTRFLKVNIEQRYKYYGVYYPWYGLNCTYVTRVTGLASPILALRQIKLPSVTRALTAVSLLTQFLKRV